MQGVDGEVRQVQLFQYHALYDEVVAVQLLESVFGKAVMLPLLL